MKEAPGPVCLDSLIHEPARLQIMATLTACVAADFMLIAAVTGLTRGNLSTHLARLVKAAYVDEDKQIVDRKPRSEYQITAVGRKAYKQYLKEWAKITGN